MEDISNSETRESDEKKIVVKRKIRNMWYQRKKKQNGSREKKNRKLCEKNGVETELLMEDNSNSVTGVAKVTGK